MSILSSLLRGISLAGLLIGVTWANWAEAIVVRPDRDDREYRALAARFPAVCWIPDDNPRGTNHGTGTLIAPRWVLTAAHVVDGGTKTVGGKLVAAHGPAATRVEFGDETHLIRRIVLYPEYLPTNFVRGQCDIALIELVEPVRNISPLPICEGRNEVGKLAHLVGFGWTGTFEAGQPNGDMAAYFAQVPTKRAATNVIDSAVGSLLITDIDLPLSATDLEGGLATADSGGPLLVQVGRGYEVAGVAHVLYGDEAQRQRFGGQDAYTRVSEYARWIEGVTGEEFGATSRIGSWVLAGAAGVVLMIGLAELRRRKRRNRTTCKDSTVVHV